MYINFLETPSTQVFFRSLTRKGVSKEVNVKTDDNVYYKFDARAREC